MRTLGPYTYVTMVMTADKRPSLNIAFHTADLWIDGSVIDDRRSYLSLNTSEARVAVTTTGGGAVTDADLATARKLASAAARYLADCKRLHTEQNPATSPVSSGEAA